MYQAVRGAHDPLLNVYLPHPQRDPMPGMQTTRRLGLWLRSLICLSMFVLVAAAGFLTWLWHERIDNVQWRNLMLSPYATQLITITGFLVRTAVSFLAIVATSMVASIALETRGVPLEAVVQFSVARFANNGPLSFFSTILGSSTLDLPLRLLAAVLLLATIASQFTSTLLVSGLGPGYVVAFPEGFADAYDFDRNRNRTFLPLTELSATSGWGQWPSSSEAFAEYWEPVEAKDGIDDTGPTVRALLPMTVQNDRETVQAFNGMARVMDGRVVCVRPQIDDLRINSVLDNDGLATLTLTGNVTRDQTVGNIWGPVNQTFKNPLSSIPRAQFRWILSPMSGGLVTQLSNTSSAQEQQAAGGGDSFLLTDAFAILDQLPDFCLLAIENRTEAVTTTLVSGQKLNSTADGPWLQQWSRIQCPNTTAASGDVKLTASLCFTTFTENPITFLNVTASSRQGRTEPQYTWDAVAEAYGSVAVREQLGATAGASSLSAEQRQIMKISPADMEAALSPLRGKPVDPVHQEVIPWLETSGRLNLAFNPTYLDRAQTVITCTTILSSLFADAIEDTNSPAKSLQAVVTAYARMMYYRLADAFIPTSNATLARFQLANIPQSSYGYWAAIAIIAAQILSFLGIAWLFRRTRFSLPDNVWHTVAQVSASAEVQGILASSRFATDDDVTALVRGVPKPRTAFGAFLRHGQNLAALFSPRPRDLAEPRFVVDEGVVVRLSGADVPIKPAGNWV